MDIATKKMINHAINHLLAHQLQARTAADWNELESAKNILRDLRDWGEVYLHSRESRRLVDYAFPERRSW